MSIKRTALIAILAATTFVGGMAVARASLGWERIPAPCNVQSLAINTNQIAVVCDGDRSTILIKQR